MLTEDILNSVKMPENRSLIYNFMHGIMPQGNPEEVMRSNRLIEKAIRAEFGNGTFGDFMIDQILREPLSSLAARGMGRPGEHGTIYPDTEG